MDTLVICPTTMVVTNQAPAATQGTSMNSWQFSAKPNVPYQRTFKVMLYGLRWYLRNDGSNGYDFLTDPTHNAAALEKFYQAHGTWQPFNWKHPHIPGKPLVVRFASVVNVPEGIEMGNGLIDAFEIDLIHHNPAYS